MTGEHRRSSKQVPEGYRVFNGNYIYDYKMPFFERNDGKSRIAYNPTTGIGELYFNAKAEAPADLRKSEKRLGKLLQEALNAKRYICIVNGNQKTKGEPVFNLNIQFHFASDTVPENAQAIQSIIENNIVPGMYKGYNPKTGETVCMEYSELPEGVTRYCIIEECNSPTFSKKGKRNTVQGYIWDYA